MTMHHYAIYDAATGAVLRVGKSTNPAILDVQVLADGEALHVGEINPGATFLPGGIPTAKPAQAIIVTPQEVKAHAGRILSYTDWLELRASSGQQIPPEMIAYRQAVRDRSGEIEAMEPIPADFRDPSYWPEEPDA